MCTSAMFCQESIFTFVAPSKTRRPDQEERIDNEDEDIMNVMSDQHLMHRGKLAEKLIIGGDDVI